MKLPHFILVSHLFIELALDTLNYYVSVAEHLCTHFIHIFLTIRPKLCHLDALDLHICVAQEYLVLVGLVAGSTFCEYDLVALPHKIIIFLPEGICHLILESLYLFDRGVMGDHLYARLSKFLS